LYLAESVVTCASQTTIGSACPPAISGTVSKVPTTRAAAAM
jgi:hypothetical protein